jgi:IS4 transposase
MTATAETKQAVLDALRESHPQWPQVPDYDTRSNPWPLAWDAAAFIEEWFAHPEHNDVEEAICHVDLSPERFAYDVTEWHFKQPPEALLKVHLLRIVKGWGGETAVCDYLKENPALVPALGFENDPASKSTLWRVWNEDRLSAEHKEVLRTIGQLIVDVARENGIAAPDEAFHPDPSVDAPDDVEQDDSSVRDRTIAKTREIWKQAKPIITENYDLDRGENSEIHENAFWEGQAFMGAREEMCAEDGTRNFAADTTRDRVQTGSTHRHHIQKITPERAREMHRAVTRVLIERAQRESKLCDEVTVAIDITKSNPYRTKKKIERDDDGNVTNPWLMGYREDEDESAEFYFQWATIQIVGLDTPLVLDALPVYRGLSRQAIVDALLASATELVDVELVLMDRAFAHDGAKAACEKHDVWYLVPGVMNASKRATCTRLRRQEKLVHIERDGYESSGLNKSVTAFGETTDDTEKDDDGSVRKQVFVPATNAEWTGDELDADDDGDAGADTDTSEDDDRDLRDFEDFSLTEESDDEEPSAARQKLRKEFADETGVDLEEEAGEDSIESVIEDVREEEEATETRGSDEDVQLYTLFETNHPDVEIPETAIDGSDEMSDREKAHMVARLIRRYKHRWGIENGFKQIKTFRVRTTSMNPQYRFFNYLFACSLYNVWRLTDVLVKLELDASGFSDKPLVTADLFLTIAKEFNMFGLDPPD